MPFPLARLQQLLFLPFHAIGHNTIRQQLGRGIVVPFRSMARGTDGKTACTENRHRSVQFPLHHDNHDKDHQRRDREPQRQTKRARAERSVNSGWDQLAVDIVHIHIY